MSEVKDLLRFALVLRCLIEGLHGFSIGAPRSTCDSMVPGHGTLQNNTPPVLLSFSHKVYTPGHELHVHIWGIRHYKGLLMQMRRLDLGIATGRLEYDAKRTDLRYNNCRGQQDAVTQHQEYGDRGNITLVWYPPDTDVGAVEFRATILKDMEKYWFVKASEPIKYSAIVGSLYDEVEANEDAGILMGDSFLDTIIAFKNTGVVLTPGVISIFCICSVLVAYT